MWAWLIRMVMGRAIVANLVMGILVATLVGGGVLAFYTKYKIEQGQALKWKVNEMEIAVVGWQNRFEDQKRRATQLEEVARAHTEQALARQERTVKVASEISTLRRDKDEVRTYMEQPIPAALLERLSAYSATSAARD